MKLIKQFTGTPLVISEVLPHSKWISPNVILDTNGTMIELTNTAAASLAHRSGLKDFKSALSLYENNPPKWRAFTDLFDASIEGDQENYCYTNPEQTVIYAFITYDYADETDELFKLYDLFAQNQYETILGELDGESVLITSALVSRDQHRIETITIFKIESAHILSFAYLKDFEGNLLHLINVYDRALVGKKHKFSVMDLDLAGYEYSLLNPDIAEFETNNKFRFSLKEVIEYLRVIQRTKHLAVDSAQFGATLIELFGEISQDTISLIDDLYSNLDEYTFYYDRNKETILNDELIFDKLKTPKARLYFTQIEYAVFKKLLMHLIKLELNKTDILLMNGFVCIDYLVELSAYFHELSQQTEFDALQIPFYWQAYNDSDY